MKNELTNREHSFRIDLNDINIQERDLDKMVKAWELGDYKIVYAVYQINSNVYLEISTTRDNRNRENDITRQWKEVMEELRQQRVPSFMLDKAKEEMDMVKETEKTSATELEGEVMTQEEAKVQVEETESDKGEVAKSDCNEKIEMTANGEEVTKDDAGEGLDQELETTQTPDPAVLNQLPPISSGDKTVTLCAKGDFKLEAIITYDKSTYKISGANFYIVESDKIYIGKDVAHINADKFRATDHTCLNFIRDYMVEFSDNDVKLAFERLKEFRNKGNGLEVSESMNVLDVYEQMIASAIDLAKSEGEQNVSEDNRECIYHEKAGDVYIRDRKLREMLDDMGAGMSPAILCKRLRLVEAHSGRKLILSNSGTGRYTKNVTGNRRYYVFAVIETEDTGKEVA